MYALEFFLGLTLMGLYAAYLLARYLKSEINNSEERRSHSADAESLLDLYESIYLEKTDNQMHRLVEWREMALQNCKARRQLRESLKESGKVRFIEDYRSPSHASSKHH